MRRFAFGIAAVVLSSALTAIMTVHAGAHEAFVERGVASWYGHPYHGRRTASGEIYDQNRLTAAHPDLPFGLEVKVTRIATGDSVVVEITDRGPFVDGRIIDLSREAARRLDMLEVGIAPVRIEATGVEVAQSDS